MIVGIVGLGLIGGSLARAYKRAGHEVYGYDHDKLNTEFVELAGVIQGVLTEERYPECDLIFLCIPPKYAKEWLERNAEDLTERTLVIDCCGTKRGICETGFSLMEKTKLLFVGGHPMAGRQVWGFKNSREDMFDGAVFAIVPKDKNDIRLLTRVKDALRPAGFARFQVMTPDVHDEIIAYTSQMPHLISNAFVKSPRAMRDEAAVAGGSFRDMTRVAYLDEQMWTELFLENRDNLLKELDGFVEELEIYRSALENEEEDVLTRLLAEGRKRKETVEAHVSAKRSR